MHSITDGDLDHLTIYYQRITYLVVMLKLIWSQNDCFLLLLYFVDRERSINHFSDMLLMFHVPFVLIRFLINFSSEVCCVHELHELFFVKKSKVIFMHEPNHTNTNWHYNLLVDFITSDLSICLPIPKKFLTHIFP